jgi:hypothetical protein
MNRSLIEQLKSKIIEDFPVFLKVGIFNNNFSNERAGVSEPLNFPAIFISFPEPISYSGNTSGVQKTNDFLVRFYIAEKFVTDRNVLDIFDLKQEVYSKFSGFQPNGFSSMERVGEQVDEDRNNIYVFIQDYKIRGTDPTNYVNNKRVPVNVNTLVVSGDLEIDQNTTEGIRTNIIVR